MDYEKLFTDIILDTLEIERGLIKSQEEIVQKFLSDGTEIDPSAAYDQINLAHTRAIRISIMKRLCMAYGLAGETEKGCFLLIGWPAYPRLILIYAFSSLCISITFEFVAASMICPANVEAFLNASSLKCA